MYELKPFLDKHSSLLIEKRNSCVQFTDVLLCGAERRKRILWPLVRISKMYFVTEVLAHAYKHKGRLMLFLKNFFDRF